MRCVSRLGLSFVFALVPGAADAQWIVSTFTGINRTLPSSITIDRPDVGTSLVFEDVAYDAKPFKSPQYYGARLTRLFGGGRGLGVEVEFLHIKVYARTRDVVHVSGTFAGSAIDDRVPMNTLVDRYNQTHGLNFFFANLVWRQPLGRGKRTALSVRAGAGPVMPGADIVMPGLNVQGYQFAGVGAQAAAGVDVRLLTWLSAMVEYKFTHARPELDLRAGGRGRMTANTHNLAMGFTIGK